MCVMPSVGPQFSQSDGRLLSISLTKCAAHSIMSISNTGFKCCTEFLTHAADNLTLRRFWALEIGEYAKKKVSLLVFLTL